MEDEEELVDLETQRAFYGLVRELVVRTHVSACKIPFVPRILHNSKLHISIGLKRSLKKSCFFLWALGCFCEFAVGCTHPNNEN